MLVRPCAICAATRPDGLLRIGYSAQRPGKFLLNVRRADPLAQLVATYWVTEVRLAKTVISEVLDGRPMVEWVALTADQFAKSLLACSKRRGIPIYTEVEFSVWQTKAKERELAAAEARIQRILDH